MAKVRTRNLWLGIRYSIPDDVSYQRIIRTLIRSIKRGDYKIPRNWRVVIEWRNKANAQMKRGEWQSELQASADSSSGFDKAVLHYLENQLDE